MSEKYEACRNIFHSECSKSSGFSSKIIKNSVGHNDNGTSLGHDYVILLQY